MATLLEQLGAVEYPTDAQLEVLVAICQQLEDAKSRAMVRHVIERLGLPERTVHHRVKALIRGGWLKRRRRHNWHLVPTEPGIKLFAAHQRNPYGVVAFVAERSRALAAARAAPA